MSERPYPEGVDCVWVASDQNGNLGAFVTGGVGPIPMLWLTDECMPIEDVEALICELPNISNVRMLVEIKRPDDFIELASRGIFVYDWRDVNRTSNECRNVYEPVAVPLAPISVERLAGGLAGMAKSLSFSDAVFSDGQPLDICLHTICRRADRLSQ